jgi:mannose-6-phosphate isomerase-like protein (cupin superfamily)
VLILRGRGRVLVGRELTDIAEHDLVYTPPGTWHQFSAAEDSHLGFLCLVNGERDRPNRPTEEDLAAFAADPELASIIRH